MQSEARLIEKIRRAYIGWAVCIKIHGGPYMERGIPDLLVIEIGNEAKYFWIETKIPGKNLTPVQEAQHKRLRSLGCTVHVVKSVERAENIRRDRDG